MKRRIVKNGFQLVVAAALVAFAALARADAGAGTLEVGIGAGYTRGIGPASAQMPSLQHLAGDGGVLRLEMAWRFDPSWSVGCYAEGSLFGAGHVAGVDGTTGWAGGVEGRFHSRPLARIDPWVSLGFGWRGLAVDHGMGTHSLTGLDLARLQVGLDHRASPRFSVAPTLGVSVTEFIWEKRPGAGEYTALADRKLSAFVFAGLSGRFDVPGGSAKRG